MAEQIVSTGTSRIERAWIWRPIESVGHGALEWLHTTTGIAAFALITLRTTLRRGAASGTIRPLIREQLYRAGVRLLPVASLVAFVLGVVILGQGLVLLDRVGAQAYAGRVMIGGMVRELGPLTVAMLVLARIGAAHVIELGIARATGEIARLEAAGTDPLRHLVVPRIAGMVLAVFSLTLCFLMVALASAYGFAFVQNVTLTPGEYGRQLSLALTWLDFPLLALKCVAFGALIAATTCYQGFARPLRMEDLARTTTRALVQGVVGCILVDLVFLAVYWLTR